jgi:hypothetical protein
VEGDGEHVDAKDGSVLVIEVECVECELEGWSFSGCDDANNRLIHEKER